MDLLKSEIEHSEVKSRAERMLKKAGIGYLSAKDAELTPDAPVLNIRVVATKMEGKSYITTKLEGNSAYSLVIEVALLQKVTVENGSKLRITATTWLASDVRPIVFCAIRNASQRTIHYCDYLLGYVETVRLYARQEGDSEWRPISLRPNPQGAYIGVLLCSQNDSLGVGKEIPPNWSHIPYGAPKVKRKYTFTEDLTHYDFPTHWKGKVECKITQTLFGGRHKDSWEGEVESPMFEIYLPVERK